VQWPVNTLRTGESHHYVTGASLSTIAVFALSEQKSFLANSVKIQSPSPIGL